MHIPDFSRPPAQHTINLGSTPHAALQVVPWEAHQALLQRFDALFAKVSYLENQLSEWVNTKEAKRITGIKSCAALKRKRELPGSLIVVRFEGIKGKIPMYLRASLIAYCESKGVKYAQPGRNLAAGN